MCVFVLDGVRVLVHVCVCKLCLWPVCVLHCVSYVLFVLCLFSSVYRTRRVCVCVSPYVHERGIDEV